MKKVLITGATGGIGSKIAEVLAANKYDLIFLSKTSNDLFDLKKKLQESYDVNIKIISCDVSDYATLKKSLEDVPELDVLINCAGILGPVGPFMENNIDDWYKTIAVNFQGTVNTVHLLLKKLMNAKKGKIINFGGGGAAFPRKYHTAYASSKTAVVRFTETLAEEYPSLDINVIAPGAHKTRIWNTETYDKEPAKWSDMQRLQKLISYLCSSDSDGVTSKFIHINDDWDKFDFRESKKHHYTLRRIDSMMMDELENPIIAKASPNSDFKICVFGLWHLGSVTCACLSNLGFSVIGFDPDTENIKSLNSGKAKIFEPGLDELIQKGLQNGKLSFTNDMQKAVSSSNFIWITFDVPVDENDVADVLFVETQIKSILKYVKKDSNIIISSQIPVTFTRKIEDECSKSYLDKNIAFAVSPENLRLGDAIRIFNHPERIIVGIRKPEDKMRFGPFFKSLTNNMEWMKIESAEMTKHAINSFFATSIVFANELAQICESVGADAKEVEKGLKTEDRIGQKARLGPGTAFAGGTLARDVNYLLDKSSQFQKKTALLAAIKESNDHHKGWIQRKCIELYGDVRGKKFGILGLAYKPNTDTLRRSSSVELCEWLSSQLGIVTAFDPNINSLPETLSKKIFLKHSITDVLIDSDCIIIATEHSSLKNIYTNNKNLFAKKIVIDPNGFIEKDIPEIKDFKYIRVGGV